MLIQRISPFVPFHHIKYGVFGVTGHSCAFLQDLEGFVDTLPRARHDVTMLKVLKTVKAEVNRDGKTYEKKTFRVRRKHVYEALVWLRGHHTGYGHIIIDPSALDWLGGDEGDLDCLILDDVTKGSDIDTLKDKNDDVGPAPNSSQFLRDKTHDGENIIPFGHIDDGGKALLSKRDGKIQKAIHDSVKRAPNKEDITIDWPKLSERALNEYSDIRIFTNAFPWLFPGGVGDAKDYPGKLATWGKNMLYFEDGRFARDKIFGFFALDHIIRMRNATSGRWFIENFHKGGPDTLDELKQKIEQGDTSFVNSISYFNASIKGSAPYWFKKKCELYSWINHHIEIGNGAPTMFITLSCAEYAWPDIIEKIKERMKMAHDSDAESCHVGSEKLTRIVNDYSIVVQEYFQLRVKKWLDSIGKVIFGIKHYWVRYEFAPGRGQIHAHLLAIPRCHGIYRLCHLDRKQPDGDKKREERLARWAEQHFGLTASVKEGFDELDAESDPPVCLRFTDVCLTPEDSDEDFQRLMKQVQIHECSGFCMRHNKSNKR
jgi:hypothetical protein